MKIAFSVRNYHKNGGISRMVAELAENLSATNEVHVFTASWDALNTSKNVIFHKVPMLSSKYLIRKKKIALNNVLEIASFGFFSFFCVRKKDFDIIHTQGRSLGYEDIFTSHSCHAESLKVLIKSRKGFWGRLKKTFVNPLHLVLLILEKLSVVRAKKIIAVSKSVKNELVGHYGIPEDKVKVIYNGVNVQGFHPQENGIDRAAVRARYGLKDSDKVVIFAANEFERKGLGPIIEMLSLLKTDDLYVLVIGEDDPEKFCTLIRENKLEKNIIFTGHVTDMENHYAAADMLVFPTAYEPFGLVVTEAMAAGLPVIVSASAGASELITDGENGLLLKDCFDPAEIAGAIQRVIEHPADSAVMGSLARRTAEQYSWENISKATYNLYGEIVSESRKKVPLKQSVPVETGAYHRVLDTLK